MNGMTRRSITSRETGVGTDDSAQRRYTEPKTAATLPSACSTSFSRDRGPAGSVCLVKPCTAPVAHAGELSANPLVREPRGVVSTYQPRSGSPSPPNHRASTPDRYTANSAAVIRPVRRMVGAARPCRLLGRASIGSAGAPRTLRYRAANRPSRNRGRSAERPSEGARELRRPDADDGPQADESSRELDPNRTAWRTLPGVGYHRPARHRTATIRCLRHRLGRAQTQGVTGHRRTAVDPPHGWRLCLLDEDVQSLSRCDQR